MLASASYRQTICYRSVFSIYCKHGYRFYTVQRSPPIPKSQAKTTESTSNPSPKVNIKNSNTATLDKNVRRSMIEKKSLEEFPMYDRLLAGAHRRPGQPLFDPFATKMQLLDVMIPTPIREVPTSKLWETAKHNLQNEFGNLQAMYQLARSYSFGNKKVWTTQLFKTHSTAPDTWTAPMRKGFLAVYKILNEAIAKGDTSTIKKLSAYEYQVQALKYAKKPSGPFSYKWTFHKEIAPCKIVSLRAIQANVSLEEPKIGNRLLVQAVVRFETLQSLDKYQNGLLIGPEGKTVPREKEEEARTPKRVLEHLVFENKLWYSDGWYIRDQLYEGVKSKFTHTGYIGP